MKETDGLSPSSFLLFLGDYELNVRVPRPAKTEI